MKKNDLIDFRAVEISTNGSTWLFFGAGMSGTYRLERFYFHWAENCHSGSEHQIDGKSYPMEVGEEYFAVA